MSELTANNVEILRLLNRYRFLTNPQLLRLGLVKESTSIHRLLRRFKDGKRPYIGGKDFGFIAGRGRLHRIYYMEKRGAKLLADTLRMDEDEISFEASRPPFLQDYFHRVATIDFHIELDLFAEQHECEIKFFHTYFDTEGANRGTPPDQRLRRLTKIPLGKYHLIPDGIFLMNTPDGKQHLFALEVYNGRDSKRVHKQLEKHMQAQAEGAISEAYGLALPYRVLMTFETEGAMKAVMSRIQGDSQFSNSEPYFAFNTIERLREDFARSWKFFSGREGTIF